MDLYEINRNKTKKHQSAPDQHILKLKSLKRSVSFSLTVKKPHLVAGLSFSIRVFFRCWWSQIVDPGLHHKPRHLQKCASNLLYSLFICENVISLI